MLRKVACLLLLLYLYLGCGAQINQPCTTLGQTPQTAFPLCGQKIFTQVTVPYCANNAIPVPGCNGNDYADVNPFWYKFTCYKSGTLDFIISPQKPNEDYDWQIFDVTGHDVSEVYTNPALFVVGNWTGTYGQTGTSSSSKYTVYCASGAGPQNATNFSSTPTLQQGHNYLLLVSHFTRAPNGYNLSFLGGTAVITDTAQPRVKSAAANCDASSVVVVFNKKLTCTSIAGNGSDFTLNTTQALVNAAQGVSCSLGFDADSVTVQFNKPLQPGTYTLFIKNGADENTLLDYCDNAVPVGDSVSFEVVKNKPTPFDSIIPAGCAPQTINLLFKKRIRCNSVAANGSDFSLTGTTAARVTGASCQSGFSNIIKVTLSGPLQQAGTYQLHLGRGTDGTTVIDECGEETLPASQSFTTKDTVSAAFNYKLLYGCKADTLAFSSRNDNGINSWRWSFEGGNTSTTQNPTLIYASYGPKKVNLSVSNGTCSDTVEATVNLDNYLKAAFVTSSPFICPGDNAVYTDSSTGNITAWYWNLGNGLTSRQPSPQIVYPPVTRDENYRVSLAVQNNLGCFDTAYTTVKIVYSCYIAVPTAFTPNGDNLNDYLYPLNAYKAVNLQFKVFNRFGQLLFSTKDWTQKWDGTFKGLPQPAGTYIWTLSYTHTETKQPYFLKGTTVLIR